MLFQYAVVDDEFALALAALERAGLLDLDLRVDAQDAAQLRRQLALEPDDGLEGIETLGEEVLAHLHLDGEGVEVVDAVDDAYVPS